MLALLILDVILYAPFVKLLQNQNKIEEEDDFDLSDGFEL